MSQELRSDSLSVKGKSWLLPSQALMGEYTSNEFEEKEHSANESIDRYGITIGGIGFSIPATVLYQVKKLSAINKLLNAPTWVVGLTNVEGSAIPVFDLAGLLEVPSVSTSASVYILLIGKSDDAVGVLLDKLPVRLNFFIEQQHEIPPIPDFLIPLVSCCYLVENIEKDKLKEKRLLSNVNQKPDSTLDNEYWLELDIDKLLVSLGQSD